MKMKALSIQQPWAWMILNAGKDIENRTWKPTNPGLRFRGPALIHVGKKVDTDGYDFAADEHPNMAQRMPSAADISLGGIVGIVEFDPPVRQHASPWFFGVYGFPLRNARALPYRPLNGILGFFDVDVTELGLEQEVLDAMRVAA